MIKSKSPSRSSFLVCLLCLVLMSPEGCKKKVAPAPSEAEQTQARFDTLEYFEIQNVAKEGVGHILHASGKGNKTTPCRIEKAQLQSSPQDLLCYLETHEFDLYYNGFAIKTLIPSKLCEYVIFSPYWFWDYESGKSTVRVDDFSGRPAECTGSCTSINASGQTQTVLCSALSSSLVGKGDFDHTAKKGPNCDEGILITTKYFFAASDNLGNCTYTASSTSASSLGGRASNCMSGPALKLGVNASGYPSDEILLASNGLEQSWEFEAPTQFHPKIANLTLANYSKEFKSGDYTYDKTSLLNYPGDRTKNDAFSSGAYPYYSWTCYNPAKEVKGRIILLVREWDKTFSTSDDIDKTNDTLKMDLGDENEPDSYGPYDDFWDWDKLQAEAKKVTGDQTKTFPFPEVFH